MLRYLLALLLACAWAGPSWAEQGQARPTATVIPAISGNQIPLPTGDARTADAEQWNRVMDQIWVRNVSRPSLYHFAPKGGRSNGRAVIVVPGGGYAFVSIESEGFRVAERLAAQGYHAFVLKYRPHRTPTDPGAFLTQVLAEWAGEDTGVDFDYLPAVDDLAAAVALVHDRASEWAIDGDKIGVVGFSAGAQSAMRLIQQKPEAALIENLAFIYPPMPGDYAMPRRPDLFMAIAIDDPLFQPEHLRLVDDWSKGGGKVEFHLYAGGSHGFGMRPQGTTSDLWIDQYLAWLAVR